MFQVSHSGALTTDPTGWPVFWAREDDQDLEFDDTFDEDDFGTAGKPPSKRPYLLILAIAIVGGLLYFTLDLDLFSSIGNMIVSPAKTTQSTGTPSVKKSSPAISGMPANISVPSPRFMEGQVVSLMAAPGSAASMVRLQNDPEGTKPGPSVRVGESLTVLDGAYVNNGWVYQVNTKSGVSGWIKGQRLKSLSS